MRNIIPNSPAADPRRARCRVFKGLCQSLTAALAALLTAGSVVSAGEAESRFENPEDFPLMGDWEGRWIDAQIGVEAHDPSVAAHLINMDPGVYELQVMPRLYIRAAPYLVTTVREENGEIRLDAHGWTGTMRDGVFTGIANLFGHQVSFEMKRAPLVPESLGAEPPPGAIVLFDGSNFDEWVHHDGRDVTWRLTGDGAMEVVSSFWNGGQNREKGLGGDIRTRGSFGDMKMHMEFRYPVEPGHRGQGRGNSGLFFHGIGELQILNSYGGAGYWDEGGSFYRMLPPMVNAAGPPLEWQTYDVELRLPRYDEETGQKLSEAIVTAYHNGHLIHNNAVIPTGHRGPVQIGLQDHINAIQFRNIWVKELEPLEDNQ